MDIFNNLFSSSDMLNEQIAQEVINNFSQSNMAIAIADLSGNLWTNQSHDFVDWQEYSALINSMFSRLDDGQDVVISNSGNYCFVASDLEIDFFSNGYVVIVLDKQFLGNIDVHFPIVEFSLRQVSVLASTIQKNNCVIHDSLKKSHTPIVA